MKFSGKPILIILVMLILAVPVFAMDFNDLQTNVDSFSKEIAESLPFNSTIGLNWSDAYIGGYPHFGVGLSTGLTTMNSKSINSVMDLFGISHVNKLPLVGNNRFPLPAYSIDSRIGLPVIPVDFGVKFGYLGQNWLKPLLGIGIKNLLVGADVRYVIVNSKVVPLRLSIGLGFNYLNGGISYTASSLNFLDSDSGLNLNAINPQVDIIWRTTNIEFKMQASFPYKILTPYAGAGISYAWSKAGYKVSSSGLSISESDKIELDKLGVTDASTKSFETIISDSGINTRVFGGFSINLAYVRLDLTGMYEIIYSNFGATFGLRFQM